MKTIIRIAVLALLALSSAAAFAGDKQINVNLYQDSTIAGVKVPAGEYKMTAVRQGPAVKFTLMRGSRTVVSTDAQFEESANFSAPVAVVTGPDSKVVQIQVAALKGAIVFERTAK